MLRDPYREIPFRCYSDPMRRTALERLYVERVGRLPARSSGPNAIPLRPFDLMRGVLSFHFFRGSDRVLFNRGFGDGWNPSIGTDPNSRTNAYRLGRSAARYLRAAYARRKRAAEGNTEQAEAA